MIYNQLPEIEILINGRPVAKYSHKGKIFIEAKEDSQYSIQIKNPSWSRKLMVCSVDGINVLDGEAAGASKGGYIINGLNSYEIKGFRVSNDTVNAFKFSKKSKSYAAKSEQTNGDTSNCGVIGIEVYNEETPPVVRKKRSYTPIEPLYPWVPENPWSNPDWRITYDNVSSNEFHEKEYGTMRCAVQPTESISCLNLASCSSFDLGTQFSDREIEDVVREVEFKTGSLYSTYEVFYASREALIEMGVPVKKEAQVSFPNAFPSKFCKPPKN